MISAQTGTDDECSCGRAMLCMWFAGLMLVVGLFKADPTGMLASVGLRGHTNIRKLLVLARQLRLHFNPDSSPGLSCMISPATKSTTHKVDKYLWVAQRSAALHVNRGVHRFV